jgi:hypothetical protein
VLFARGKAYLKQNVVYFAVYTATFVSTILAPGNFIRDATVTADRHDLAGALSLTKQSGLIFIESHLLPHIALLLALVLAAIAAGWLVKRPPLRAAKLAPAVLALTLSFPMHFLVYTYLTGEAVPGRVLNQAYVMALMGVFLAVAWIGSALAARTSARPERLVLACFGLIGLCLLTSGHLRNVAVTARDFGPTWKQIQLARDVKLKLASRIGQDPVLVDPFPPERSASPVLAGADVTDDPGYWVNRCMADYYGVGSIVLRTTDSSRPPSD